MAGNDGTMITNDKIIFSKSGVVTTSTTGVANVVFRNPYEYGQTYSVQLTCEFLGLSQVVVAYASSVSQTGFTINSYIINQPGGAGVNPCTLTVQGGVTIHWSTIIDFNG
jgi:hypothetical protein